MAAILLNRNRQVPAEETPAFGGIAERFRRAGDLDRAIALCRDGLKRFPDQLSARVTLGWALLDSGQTEAARLELEQVLRRAPDNLAAIRGMAELHDRSDGALPSEEERESWRKEEAAASAAREAEPAPTPEVAPLAVPEPDADRFAPIPVSFGETSVDESAPEIWQTADHAQLVAEAAAATATDFDPGAVVSPVPFDAQVLIETTEEAPSPFLVMDPDDAELDPPQVEDEAGAVELFGNAEFALLESAGFGSDIEVLEAAAPDVAFVTGVDLLDPAAQLFDQAEQPDDLAAALFDQAARLDASIESIESIDPLFDSVAPAHQHASMVPDLPPDLVYAADVAASGTFALTGGFADASEDIGVAGESALLLDDSERASGALDLDYPGPLLLHEDDGLALTTGAAEEAPVYFETRLELPPSPLAALERFLRKVELRRLELQSESVA